MTFKNHVNQYLSYDLSEHQIEMFAKYFNFLIEYNHITNLTRITNETEVYYKHFYDSITPINHIDFQSVDTMCDMGAGAGFPSIPIKILFPHIKLTIIDSLGKRISFLNQLTALLELTDVDIINQRIEVYGQTNQNKFDLVTARALGHLRLISEMAIPMVKTGGIFLAYKASNYEDEISESLNAIEQLGSNIASVKTFDLPLDYGFRSHIVIKKTKYIKGYPREYQQMIKKPL
ncbi:MAG: 16S rRNA (guanine(527)-N(7))-methyltransferase RsmG [Acholeplasmataceae bacterium]